MSHHFVSLHISLVAGVSSPVTGVLNMSLALTTLIKIRPAEDNSHLDVTKKMIFD